VLLQCVAVCCSVLQCVAVCCSVFQCVNDTRGLVVTFVLLQCVLLCALQCVAECVAVCCSVLQCVLQCVTVRSPVLHARAQIKASWCIFEGVAVCVEACVALCCNALQRAFPCVFKVSWSLFNRDLPTSLAGSSLVYLFFSPLFLSFKRDCYRVAKTHRMPSLQFSFGKRATNYRALCRK